MNHDDMALEFESTVLPRVNGKLSRKARRALARAAKHQGEERSMDIAIVRHRRLMKAFR